MAVLARHAVNARTERFFYSGMAIAIAVIVFAGFAPTFYLRDHIALPAGVVVPLSPLKVVHGAVATAWICLFLVQTLLVASARVTIHRRFGVLGAVLAVAMAVVGVLMTVDALRRGVDPVGVDPRVWWLGSTLPPIVLFAVLVAAGILLRRRLDVHKRLMLLATINLVPPAIGRIALFNLDASLLTPFSVSALLALVLTPIAYDLATRRRVYPVLVVGGAATMLMPWVMFAVARTPAGLAFADLFL